MSSSDEMYKLGIRDAEQDDLNLFYYQHYYYYRQGYDQARRGKKHGGISPYIVWLKRLLPFAAVFALVVVVVSAGFFALRFFQSRTNTDGANSPTHTVGMIDTPPVAVTTSLPPVSSVVASSSGMLLQVGGQARVVNVGGSPLHARTEPGLESPIKASFPEGSQVTIVDGPVDVDGYKWWYLESANGSGWCAESGPDGMVWLDTMTSGETATRNTTPTVLVQTATPRTTTSPTTISPTPTPPIDPTKLRVGGKAEVVNMGDSRLSGRAEPGISSDIVANLANGTQVTVLDGPVDADGFIWWQVESNEGIGWSAQGDSRGTIWLQPVIQVAINNRETTSTVLAFTTAQPTPSENATMSATATPTEAATPTSTPTPSPTSTSTPTPSPTPTPTPTPSSPLHVGGTAEVVNVGEAALSGRVEPGSGKEVKTHFPEGSQVTILQGPVEVDGYKWWRIESDKGTGWSAEGDPSSGTVWLKPL